jgi:hypothetical protein
MPLRLPRVALDHGDEPVFVRGAGFEPALAMEHLVHDASRQA